MIMLVNFNFNELLNGIQKLPESFRSFFFSLSFELHALED